MPFAPGANHPDWKGGIRSFGVGYIGIYQPQHPRAGKYGYVLEHLLVAEEALKKPLPEQAVIHHVNENRRDNRPCNLVICQDQAYHVLLHARLRALKACGNPNWRKCRYCWKFDSLENLSKAKKKEEYLHKHCDALRQARLYRIKNNNS